MLEQIAERLGRGLFTVCTAAGKAIADVLDKGIDNICNRIENEKTDKQVIIFNQGTINMCYACK